MTRSIRRFADFFIVRNRRRRAGAGAWRRIKFQFSPLDSVAGAFAGAGFTVLRCDLPFRQNRPYGPPRPGDAERDRDGLRNAVAALRKLGCARMFLGGHSYGGRQATMLCAGEPDLVSGVAVAFLSTASAAQAGAASSAAFAGVAGAGVVCAWDARSFWVDRGNADGGEDDSGKDELLKVDGAGHDLGFKGKAVREEVVGEVVTAFSDFFGTDEMRRDCRFARAWTLAPT